MVLNLLLRSIQGICGSKRRKKVLVVLGVDEVNAFFDIVFFGAVVYCIDLKK